MEAMRLSNLPEVRGSWWRSHKQNIPFSAPPGIFLPQHCHLLPKAHCTSKRWVLSFVSTGHEQKKGWKIIFCLASHCGRGTNPICVPTYTAYAQKAELSDLQDKDSAVALHYSTGLSFYSTSSGPSSCNHEKHTAHCINKKCLLLSNHSVDILAMLVQQLRPVPHHWDQLGWCCLAFASTLNRVSLSNKVTISKMPMVNSRWPGLNPWLWLNNDNRTFVLGQMYARNNFSNLLAQTTDSQCSGQALTPFDDLVKI